jgi:hypothetical protein
MPLGSLLLAAAMIILVGLFLARPLILSPGIRQSRLTVRQELLNQKETLLAQIEILDFDFETSLLPEQEYKRQRRHLLTQAAEILMKLDEYTDLPDGQQAGTIEEEIETAVASLRQHQPQPKPAALPSPQPAAQPVTENGHINFCAQCGQSVESGDKFCAYCGHKIYQS